MKELNELADILTKNAEVTGQLFKRVETLEAQQQLESQEVFNTVNFCMMQTLADSFPEFRKNLILFLEQHTKGPIPDNLNSEAFIAVCEKLIEHLSLEPGEVKQMKPDWFRGVIQGKKMAERIDDST